VKFAFSSRGCALGASGSVQFLFERRGVVAGAGGAPGEAAELTLIDAGADDFSFDDGEFEIVCAVPRLGAVRAATEAAGLRIDSADIVWVPKERRPAAEPDSLRDLLDSLDDDEDVSAVYTNVEI
jgi:transcriptional/translational regulatory protein YebC/TACO1